VRWLLENGAEPNYRYSNNYSPLLNAAANGQSGNSETSSSSRRRSSCENQRRLKTQLAYAEERKHEAVAEYLRAQGVFLRRSISQYDAIDALQPCPFPYSSRQARSNFIRNLVFETLAYATAFLVYLAMRKRRGDALDDGDRWWVIAAAAMGAVVGCKVLYWFEDPAATLARWHDPAFLMGGKTIVGGLIGGLFFVELAKHHLGVGRRTGDLFCDSALHRNRHRPHRLFSYGSRGPHRRRRDALAVGS